MKKRHLIAVATLSATILATHPARAWQVESPDVEAEHVGGFVCALPGGADALPGLAEQLGSECEQERYGFEERQTEERQFNTDMPGMADNLIYQQNWGIAGRTDRLLSLASEIYRYDGGAHGNTGYAARIWNIEQDRGIAFPALFTDRYAAYSVIDKEFCRLLADMQRDREIDTHGDDLWGGCPLLHEQTIVPQGEPGRPFTSIGIMVAPYIAGPYSAGSFEVSVEVTPELIALLRPEFRGDFAAPDTMGGVSGGD